MRVVALILVVVAAHLGYRGAMVLGTSLQDTAELSSGPQGLMYLLLAGALLLAASFAHRLQLFSTTPARTANMNDHNHVTPPADTAGEADQTRTTFSGISVLGGKKKSTTKTTDHTAPPSADDKAGKGGSGRTCLIDFDLEQLRINRWEAKNRTATDEEVRVWLMSQGYIPTPDGWLGDDVNLSEFERSEITRCRSIARSNSKLEEQRRREVQRTISQWSEAQHGRATIRKRES